MNGGGEMLACFQNWVSLWVKDPQSSFLCGVLPLCPSGPDPFSPAVTTTRAPLLFHGGYPWPCKSFANVPNVNLPVETCWTECFSVAVIFPVCVYVCTRVCVRVCTYHAWRICTDLRWPLILRS